MSMQDPVGDMFTRIRNAALVKKEMVFIPFSKHKKNILDVLQKEGYIEKFEVVQDAKEHQSKLAVSLKYFNGKSVIEHMKQISKPSLRIYKSCRKLLKIRNGMGIAVISTPKGVLSDSEARLQRQGGEVLVEIY